MTAKWLGNGSERVFSIDTFVHFQFEPMRQYYLITYKKIKRKEERRKRERDVLGEKIKHVHYEVSGRYKGVPKIPLNYL